MFITLYTPIGIVYQKFTINETDIIYDDLLKYINLPKHELYDELDESIKIRNKVFIKTIINLFNYENSKEIKLDDEINGYEFTILFSYEYYIYYNKYEKIENNIENCNNINSINSVNSVIKNDPYQIIFINSDNEKYYENCKLAVKNNGHALQCINPELRTDEICKLAVQHDSFVLEYVEKQTDEICKLAVQQFGLALEFVKPELMSYEMCKLAVQDNGCALEFVKPELMSDEICKLAVQQNCYSLQYVPPELIIKLRFL